MSIINKNAFVRAAAAMLAASTAMVVTGASAQTTCGGCLEHRERARQGAARHLGRRPHVARPVGEARRRLPEVRVGRRGSRRPRFPADKPEVGSFYDALRPQPGPAEGPDHQRAAASKYGALYQSMMDENRVEQLGIEPLKPDLAKVAAITSKSRDCARHMGTTDGELRKRALRLRPRARHGRRVDELAQPLPERASACRTATII